MLGEDGLSAHEETLHGCNVTTLTVQKPQSAAQLNREIGTYITIHSDTPFDKLTNIIPTGECLSEILGRLLQPYYNKKLCICGIGNRYFPATSLGSEVVHDLLLKPIAEKEVRSNFSDICSFSPEIATISNINTATFIDKTAKALQADCILLVTSCLTHTPSQLFQTLQLSTAKNGNLKFIDPDIDYSSIDIPIISLCVPTAFSSEYILANEDILTSITIHDIISAAGTIITYAILQACWPSLSKEKCFLLSKANQGPIQYGSLLDRFKK